MSIHKLPNKFSIPFEYFRPLTWRERLKILIGYNIKTRSKVVVNRRESKVMAMTQIFVTKEVTAEGQSQADMKEEL